VSLQPPATLTVPDDSLSRLQKGRCRGCGCALPDVRPAATLSSLWRSLGSTVSAPAPRRCHLDGWLYCPDCHSGETSVVPSQVLAKWDFKRYPVSDNALAYLQVCPAAMLGLRHPPGGPDLACALQATQAQQVLRIEDVNPALYAYVPLLAEARSQRALAVQALRVARRAGAAGEAKAEALLQRAGRRHYLLESEDYWSLDDLVELSQGSFSHLPQWLGAWREQMQSLAAAAVLSSPRASAQL